MSKFPALKKHLGFSAAVLVYFKLKTKKLDATKVKNLSHPFKMRDNPFDYATFEEVILKETYNIPLDFSPKKIIDCGGNIGLTACYFATKFPQANIITIEPDTDNFTVLSENIARYTNITAVKAGVWNKQTNLKITNASAGNNSFIVEEKKSPDGDTIEAVSIPSLMEQFGWDHIDIVKMDIEGAEKEVFSEGFEGWLPKTKVVIIELHDFIKQGCSKAVFHAFGQFNFSFNIKGENIIFTNLSFGNRH